MNISWENINSYKWQTFHKMHGVISGIKIFLMQTDNKKNINLFVNYK